VEVAMLKRIVLAVCIITSQISLARPSPPANEKPLNAGRETGASLEPTMLTLGDIASLKQPPSGPLIIYLSESEWIHAIKEMRPSTKPPTEGTVVIQAIADSRGGVVLVPSCKAPKSKTCRVMPQMDTVGLSLIPQIYPAPTVPGGAVEPPEEPPSVLVSTCRHKLGIDPSTGRPFPYCSGSCEVVHVPGGGQGDLSSCTVFLGSNGDYHYFYCACTSG
jgi:hypothetical protein